MIGLVYGNRFDLETSPSRTFFALRLEPGNYAKRDPRITVVEWDLVVPICEVRLQVVGLCPYAKVRCQAVFHAAPERHDKRVIAHQRMEVSLMCKSNSEKSVSKGGELGTKRQLRAEH